MTSKNIEIFEFDRQVSLASPNSEFNLDRPVTEEHIAAQYNNFYEINEAKDDILKRVGGFMTKPWILEIIGLVYNPQLIDLDEF